MAFLELKCTNCGYEFEELVRGDYPKCPKCGGYMVMKGSKIVCADEQCGYVTEKKEKNQE